MGVWPFGRPKTANLAEGQKKRSRRASNLARHKHKPLKYIGIYYGSGWPSPC
jgi:hypothetical protein